MRAIRAAVMAVATVAGHTVRVYRSVGRYLPGLFGAGFVSWGAAMVYIPAGFIVGGVLLLALDQQIPGRAHSVADGDDG